MDVGKMNLDSRDSNSRDGIAESDAWVRVGGGVKHDYIEVPLRLLNPSHQFPLLIGLPEFDCRAALRRPLPDKLLDVSQGRASVDFRFALPQQIEIRPVQEQDFHG